MGRIREERAFWAHQLHVTLLNSIGAAIVQSQVCEQAIRYGSPHSLNELGRLKDILHDLEGATRSLAAAAVRNMRVSLADDVQRTIVGFRNGYPGIAISLDFNQTEAQVHGRVVRATVVVLTEAIANAVKHAMPTRIEVDLGVDQWSVFLRVRDDGRGFDTRQVSQSGECERSSRKCGFVIMREFAEALGGKLVVSSVPGRGTQVTLHLPQEPNSPSISSRSPASSTEAGTADLPALDVKGSR